MRKDGTSPFKHPGSLLIYAGNAACLVSLFLVRTTRIRGSDESLWSASFISLLMGVGILVAISTWAVSSGSLQQAMEALPPARRAPLLVGWGVGSYALLILLPGVATFVRPYLAPFIVWLTCVNTALVVMGLLSTRQERAARAGVAAAPSSQLFRKLGLVILSIFVSLVMLELGLRVWLTYFGSEHDRAAYTYTGQEIADTQSIYVGLPYVNYGLTPNSRDHNSLGYRGPEITRPKPEGVFRIVALGGSTTYGISIPWQEAYPAQLQRTLRDEYGYTNVEVINAGVMGYTSWDLLANFEFRVLELDPDLIIVYEGINDVDTRLVDPRYYDSLNSARGTWRDRAPSLSPSVLYRFLAINLGWMRDPTVLGNQFNIGSNVERCKAADDCSNLGMTPQEVLAANPPVYYERNLNNLIMLATGNGVQVMLSSWASFPDPMGKGINPFITYAPIQQAVGEHNAIVAKLAEKWSLPYYDLAGEMPHNAGFWLDGLHMTELGAHEQASRYAAFLDANQLIPAP